LQNNLNSDNVRSERGDYISLLFGGAGADDDDVIASRAVLMSK
jgi:hypothetical protein